MIMATATTSVLSLLFYAAIVIGLLSSCLLHYGQPRPWKIHVGSFGVGASLGGFFSIIFVREYAMEYLDFIYAFLAAVALNDIIANLSPIADILLIAAALLAGPLMGGTLMWFIYYRQNQKDAENV